MKLGTVTVMKTKKFIRTRTVIRTGPETGTGTVIGNGTGIEIVMLMVIISGPVLRLGK